MPSQLALMLIGFATGGSLIIAIGAQNAYVLRQGLRREHVGLVIAICAVCDAALIVLGVAGIGLVSRLHPDTLTWLKYAGATYLVWFGLRSLRNARTAEGLKADRAPMPAGSIAATTLALTLLNPHVYLDTMVLLGSIANQHGPQGRWWFATGAVTSSVTWFTALGLGARALAPKLAHPRTWQVIDVVVGVTMLVIAVLLVLG